MVDNIFLNYLSYNFVVSNIICIFANENIIITLNI